MMKKQGSGVLNGLMAQSHSCFHRPPSAAFMGSLSLLLQAQETRWSRGVGKALSVQAPFLAADPKGGTGRETG